MNLNVSVDSNADSALSIAFENSRNERQNVRDLYSISDAASRLKLRHLRKYTYVRSRAVMIKIRNSVFNYDIKISKKKLHQQRGLD